MKVHHHSPQLEAALTLYVLLCFQLENMKGSTVDSMSGTCLQAIRAFLAVLWVDLCLTDCMLVTTDAVDNAEVMLSCICLAYKESASECPSTVAPLSLGLYRF